MSSPLESIMANAVTAVASDTTFKTVIRGRIIGQSYPSNAVPAVGIWRYANRFKPQRSCKETAVYDLVLVAEIVGASGNNNTQRDQELIDLRNRVNAKLINSTLNNNCSAIQPKGDDGTTDPVTPVGYEQVVLTTSYQETNPNNS